MSISARMSCIARSAIVNNIWRDFEAFQRCDEASLNPRRGWHGESLVLTLRAFWDGNEAMRIRGILRTSDMAHKTVYNLARGDVGERRHSMTLFLLQRARRWTEYDDDLVQAYFEFSAHKPPPDLLSSVLRTLLFGWCTSTRFHHPLASCWFCQAHGQDRQAHYLACPMVRTWYEERLGCWTQPEDEAMHAWIFMKLHSQISQSMQAAVAVDVVLTAFDTKRHGSRQIPHALMDARLKELRRRHKQIRDSVPYLSLEIRPD